MEIHYNDIQRAPAELGQGAIFHATPAELMPHCDFLALHCVASPQTIKLLNAKLIALLPDGAIVVNASRGVVIDDDALIAALKSGKLTAAGLDVYNNEPDIHPEYRALPNVFPDAAHRQRHQGNAGCHGFPRARQPGCSVRRQGAARPRRLRHCAGVDGQGREKGSN